MKLGDENPHSAKPHEIEHMINDPAFKCFMFEVEQRRLGALSGWQNDENEWKDDIAFKAIYKELGEILRLPDILKEALQSHVEHQRLASDLEGSE